MITCLTKLILFIISIWEVCRAWLASGCWRVCLISVGGRLHCSGQVKADLCLLAITAVIANHGVVACVHSHQWQECLHSLIFIPLSAGTFLDGFPFEKICSCSAPCVRQRCVRALSDSTHTAVCVHSTPQSLKQLSLPFECCKVLGRVLTALFAEPYLKNKLSESSRSV